MNKVLKENLQRFGVSLAPSLITLLVNSLSFVEVNPEVRRSLESDKQNYTLGFWHGKMLAGWFLGKQNNFMGITSKSKDGDVLAGLLSHWGYTVVRGSSSTGGKEVLEHAVNFLKTGGSVAVTPDGPKGPAMQLKPGIVVASHRAGTPIVLAGIGYSKSFHLKSWDSFSVPYPFSSVYIKYSEPLSVPVDATREKISEIIYSVESTLNRLEQEAEEIANAH